ncbi:MAG: radical SAM/Cys-rich domain protein [Nitrospinaceae bacterium]|jgi:radical SAM/Cys-rich protein|nr:radical SAM/Cys-rich domain protein [Nitrospinaceae bacterium]MBT3434338.1 radical SAM/Cys-rich domain protein [Nitrospinaceae bacterium]MBT3821706.1 radical SAM/Cys-rich domain protein [Nitrospinaceae bacterium]MBT4094965.1 radical SAM/Cys-rich domain protein [Nitrospinaceae bacterium]MBT4432236.1 radical SAM/Cys-rich domain protein [Nitrospinaceae bacterium]
METSAALPTIETGERNTHFQTRIAEDAGRLDRTSLGTLQVNVGKFCNQTCEHCHVGAGPHRKEIMTSNTAGRILDWLASSDIETVDITGGAPELNPNFRQIVETARALGRHVMIRCNLSVIFEPDMEWLPAFYREQGVELICSLPCYLEENVDSQRGEGVYEKSIRALLALNEVGFGPPGELTLNLVYNPVGAHLPPPQKELEEDYRRELGERYGIRFNELFTITNMPISRFYSYLKISGQAESYMNMLRTSYNPDTLPGLMCRNLISVAWDGTLFDCDFNQMLDMSLGNGTPLKLWDTLPENLIGRDILTGNHCFGCTAGTGSSCGGALA